MTNPFPFPQQGDFPGRQWPGNINLPLIPGQPSNLFPGGPNQPGNRPGGPGNPPGQRPQGPPSTPPPSFTPQRNSSDVGVFAVDPGSIRGCLFRNTYIWLDNGRSFWIYPTYVGRNSVSGFRWNGFMWTYYGTDLGRVSSFQCF